MQNIQVRISAHCEKWEVGFQRNGRWAFTGGCDWMVGDPLLHWNVLAWLCDANYFAFGTKAKDSIKIL